MKTKSILGFICFATIIAVMTLVFSFSLLSNNANAAGNAEAFCAGFGAGTPSYAICVAEYNERFEELKCADFGTGADGSPLYLECLDNVASGIQTNFDSTLDYIPPDQARTDYKCTDSDGNEVGIAIDVNCDETQDNVITAYLNGIINFLAVGVGLIVVVMVAVGGVQYMVSGGNPQATQAATKRITDAIIGLLFFIFLYAFLQWVIPGGPF